MSKLFRVMMVGTALMVGLTISSQAMARRPGVWPQYDKAPTRSRSTQSQPMRSPSASTPITYRSFDTFVRDTGRRTRPYSQMQYVDSTPTNSPLQASSPIDASTPIEGPTPGTPIVDESMPPAPLPNTPGTPKAPKTGDEESGSDQASGNMVDAQPPYGSFFGPEPTPAIKGNLDMMKNFSDTQKLLPIEPRVIEGASEDSLQQMEAEEEAPGLLGYFGHGNEAISFEYLYTGESFTNMRGGINTRNATRYFGLFEMAMTADTEALGWWEGGTAFLYALNPHGVGIDGDIGDAQGYSNIVVGPESQLFQMEEYWYQHDFCDSLFMLRVGKQDANYDFAVVEVAGDFINSSFGFHPTIPLPSYPDGAMGVVADVELADDLLFRAGFYDSESNGRTWGFSGTGETFSMYEIEKMWDLNGHPGEFHGGMWLDSADYAHKGGNLFNTRNHGYGMYLGAEHLLMREDLCDPDNIQGLAIFGQYAWSPGDYMDADQYYGLGMVYLGLLEGRDEDVTGLAIASISFSDYDFLKDEVAIELFYKYQLNPYVTIQPDLQYIAAPSGMNRDAFIGGIRVSMVL